MLCNKQKITAYTRLYNGVSFSWNQFRDSSPFRVFFPTQLHSNKFNLILIIKHHANTLLWIHFHEITFIFSCSRFQVKAREPKRMKKCAGENMKMRFKSLATWIFIYHFLLNQANFCLHFLFASNFGIPVGVQYLVCSHLVGCSFRIKCIRVYKALM